MSIIDFAVFVFKIILGAVLGIIAASVIIFGSFVMTMSIWWTLVG